MASDLPPLGTEEEFAAMLAELAAAYAPARFALCAEEPVRVDGQVIAWGLDFGDRALVYTMDASPPMLCGSAERARGLFGILGPVRLIWVDQPERDAA